MRGAQTFSWPPGDCRRPLQAARPGVVRLALQRRRFAIYRSQKSFAAFTRPEGPEPAAGIRAGSFAPVPFPMTRGRPHSGLRRFAMRTSQSTSGPRTDDDPHKPLREDVRLLGALLGDVLREREGEALLESVEGVRALAKRAHGGDPAAFEELAVRLRDVPISAAVPVARAFAHFLALANIAEQHHRVRRRRDYARDAGRRPQPGSCADLFARWRAEGRSPAALAEAVRGLRIELVLTAHPTEIVRRTLLQTHRRIADLLALRDRPDLTPDE